MGDQYQDQPSGPVFYVAPDGSDRNSGALESPFATIAKAYSLAGPGATIYVRGGTYNLSSRILLDKSGASGSPIRIWNYPGEKPVLDFAAMTDTGYFAGWPVHIKDASYNHLRGFEIRNGPEGGVAVTGVSKFNVIEANDVHHNGRLSNWEGKGIAIFGDEPEDTLVLNNDSHHNKNVPNNGNDSDGFFIQGARSIVIGNRAWRNSDDGFDTFDGQPSAFKYNMAFENGYDDSLNPAGGDGNGFKLGGQHPGGDSGGHMVLNNIAWGNLRMGFDENAATRPMTILNNTAYDNSDHNWYFVYQPPLSHVVQNNIGYLGNNRADSGTNDFNSWNTAGVSVSAADFITLVDTDARTPRQGNGSIPAFDFLELSPGSEMNAAGVGGAAMGVNFIDYFSPGSGGGGNTSDTTPPSLVIFSNDADGILRRGETTTLSFDFDEPVVGFTVSDIAVSPTMGTLGSLVQDSVDPTIYRASFTPSRNAAGALSVSVGSGYNDNAGNAGSGARRDLYVNTRTSDVGGAENDTLLGAASADFIDGAGGDDTISGRAGADWLLGGAGADALFGGAGNDMLFGQAGDDQLNGGTGADLFVFNQPAFGKDTIQDYRETEGDLIDLRGLDLTYDGLAISQSGGNALVTIGADTITVANMLAANLDAGNFLF